MEYIEESVKLSSIKIPSLYLKTKPRRDNIIKHRNFYDKYGWYSGNIVIDKTNTLVDGYITYLLMKEKHMKTVNVVRVDEKITRSQLNGAHKKKVFDKDNGICYMCGNAVSYSSFTIDHVVPKSKGGSNTIDNMRCCCSSCNSLKGNMTPNELKYKMLQVLWFCKEMKEE